MMSRRIVGAAWVLVAACAGSHTSEPAWPKPHATDTDGGESIAPRSTTQIAESPAASDDAAPAVAATPAVPAAAGSSAAPTAAPQTIVAPTEEINAEEMNIEVDE